MNEEPKRPLHGTRGLWREQLVPALVSVVGRFGSIGIVFVVLAILARRLAPPEYGSFVIGFGFAAIFQATSGLGAPDGAVRTAAAALASRDYQSARAAVSTSIVISIGTTVFSALVGLALFVVLPANPTFAAIAFWVAGWGLLFAAAQSLLAAGLSQSGGLFFYSAGSISMLFTTIPYATLASKPTGAEAIAVTAFGYTIAALVGLALAYRRLRTLGAGRVLADPWPLLKTGFPFGATRFVQSAFIWSVPMAVGLFHGPAEAGVVGTALRFVAAVWAPFAVFRFVFRPAIIRHWTLGEMGALQRLGTTTVAVAGCCAVVAILLSMAFGGQVLAILFGETFSAAGPFLVVGLFAVLGEALTGIADDVVRVADRAGKTLIFQIVLSLTFSIAVLAVSIHGSFAALIIYASYFYAFGLVMQIWARARLTQGNLNQVAPKGAA